MNFFSKLFSPTPKPSILATQCNENTLEYLRFLFEESAELYVKVPLFHQKQKQIIDYMMIHPRAGIVLFNFFDYTPDELKEMTVSVAKEGEKKPGIKTKDIKNFLELRLDETFHSKQIPIHSILICSNLSESEFDVLDESFHALIPKSSTLFNDSSSETYYERILGNSDHNEDYQLGRIKQALFGEFILPEKNRLMSVEQQKILHMEIERKSLIKGLPGSGKSSLLIAKALYEKMKNPQLRLVIFAKRTCNVHHLQSMIFMFVENVHWGLNPADITVQNFDTLQKLTKDKEKYDLIICDEINAEDISMLESLLNKTGKILASSSYDIDGFDTRQLSESFELPPALRAACEGFKVQKLNECLSLQNDTSAKNILTIIDRLLKEVSCEKVAVLHHNKEELFKLQTAINNSFTPISYMHDDMDRKEGIMLYPLSHLACVKNDYVIIVVDDLSLYDGIELISRAKIKSFILSEDKDIYELINLIKGRISESY